MNQSIIGTQPFRQTMELAKKVQDRYNRWGTNDTQNIRNPLPMTGMIMAVLPILPRYDRVLSFETPVKTTKFTYKGKTITHIISGGTVLKYPHDFLGKEFYQEKALAWPEIIKAIKDIGGIVNSIWTVRQSISTLLWSGKIRRLHISTDRNKSLCFNFPQYYGERDNTHWDESQQARVPNKSKDDVYLWGASPYLYYIPESEA